MNREYTYFISYSHPRGFGNLQMTRTLPIKDIRDIQAVARGIEETTGFRDKFITVLNFQLFD